MLDRSLGVGRHNGTKKALDVTDYQLRRLFVADKRRHRRRILNVDEIAQQDAIDASPAHLPDAEPAAEQEEAYMNAREGEPVDTDLRHPR